MWEVVFMSVCLGLSSGLQPGLEYRYSYAGRLATGVTEMRHQLAAVGVKADLTLQVEENNTILMKLDNLEAGDFHDDLSCDLRSPVPIIYQPLQEGTESLQKPFRVSLRNGGNAYVHVAEDEVSWVTNFRKSVVNMFPLSALWGEIQQTYLTRTIFEKEEQLMGGRCRNRYTVLRMSTEEAIGANRLRESNIVEDVQFKASPSSEDVSPGLADELWTVTRTVDYDTCNQLVEMKINMDERNNAFISRTSEGRYVVRGDALGMRVERAVVEGGVSVLTSSRSTDHIDTFTNQTLELRAVKFISSKLDLGNSTLRLRSSQYEVDRFEDRGDSLPGHYGDMDERLTGILKTAEDLQSLEMNIFIALNKTSSSVPGNLATLIDTVVKSVSSLSYDQIKYIHKRLVENYQLDNSDLPLALWQRQNFEKALTLAGTKPAVEFMLDLFEKSEKGSVETRKQTIFFAQQISTSLKAPSLVPRIMDYAFNLPWGYDYPRKAIFLNAASSLAAKFCFAGELRRNAYKEMSLNHEVPYNCNEVIHPFIDYIRDTVQADERISLYELILIQALVNLGTPLSIEILQPIVLGSRGQEVNVRAVAMTGLSAHILPKSAFGMVYNMLMPIIVNKEDFPEVRSMAFLTLASWRPGLNWWKQMAVSTWHDPSIEVANAISSLIRGFALQGGGQSEMAEMASQVVHLTRPADSVSFSHSSSIYLHNILNSDYPDKDISIMWFANTEGLLPSHLFITYQMQRLQGFSSPSKISVHQKNIGHVLGDIKRFLYDRLPRETIRSNRPPFELMWNLREELGIDALDRAVFGQLLINFEDFFIAQNTHDRKFVRRAPRFIDTLIEYVPWITADNAYQKTVDSTVAYPTDIGLPFIVQYSALSASKFRRTSPYFSPQPTDYPSRPNWRIGYDISAQISHETSVSTETMVPWLKSTVGSGIRSKSNVFLPIHVDPAAYLNSYQLAVRLSRSSQGDGTLVEASNHPYTALNRGLSLSSPSLDGSGYKHIRRKNGQQFSEKTRVAQWTGIPFESSWEGDVKQPSLASIIGDEFSCLSPTYDNWDFNLIHSNESTDTKNITLLFTVGAALRTTIFDVNPVMKFLALRSQDEGNSSSVSEDILRQRIQRREFTEDQQNGLGGEMVKGLTRIHQALDQVKSGVATSLNARVFVDNSVNSTFDALLNWVYDYYQDKLKHDLKLHLREECQGLPDETQETCVNFGLESPHILPLTTVEEVLRSDLSSSFKSDVYIGNNCNDLPVLAVQGNLNVTKEQLDKIRQKLDVSNCDTYADSPVKDITTSQIYDDAEVNIRWTENFPDSWKNLGRRLYNFVDRLLQGYSSGSTCDNYGASSSNLSRPADSAAISIKASKELNTGRVRVESSFPEKGCKHEISNLPPFLGSPASTIDVFTHRFLNGRHPGICTIESERIQNFDGAIIPFIPNNCWKVAVLDLDSGTFAIYVRFTTGWEVKVMANEEVIYFDKDSGPILLYGEPAVSSDNKYTYFKQDNATQLVFNNGISVKISDRVEVHLLPFTGRSSVSGLCGRYNGERTFETEGPKGCFFQDPGLFASAWEVSGGEGCKGIGHEDRKREVRKYQEGCQKGPYSPTGDNRFLLLEINKCVTWHYETRREGPCICEAMTPTPTCWLVCSSNATVQEQIPFECHQVNGSTVEEANCQIDSLPINIPIDCQLH